MDNDMFSLRVLTEEDWQAFRALRLYALRVSPEAFGRTVEEEEGYSDEEITTRLYPVYTFPERFIVGAWTADGQLAGMVGFFREGVVKSQHKGTIWGMFVHPEYRRHGIGRMLMLDILQRIAWIGGVERVNLCVNSVNEPARRLYESLGFVVFGTEHKAMKTGDVYADEDYMCLEL